MTENQVFFYSFITLGIFLLPIIAALYVSQLLIRRKKRTEYKNNINALRITVQQETLRLFTRELHDSVIPHMAFLRIALKTWEEHCLQEDEELMKNAQQINILCLKQVKELSQMISPEVLKSEGLIAIVQRYVSYLKSAKKMKFSLQITTPFEPEAETAGIVFGFFLESVGNALQHSRASQVDIIIGEKNDTWAMCIQDDGRGFDQQTIKHGNGLLNMQTRAALMNGRLTIRSSPGKGCLVELLLPGMNGNNPFPDSK